MGNKLKMTTLDTGPDGEGDVLKKVNNFPLTLFPIT
jgi:hypothetical protein